MFFKKKRLFGAVPAKLSVALFPFSVTKIGSKNLKEHDAYEHANLVI